MGDVDLRGSGDRPFVDFDQLPLFVVNGPKVAGSDFATAVVEGTTRMIEAGQPFCMLCDLGESSRMELPEIKQFAQFLRARGAELDELMVAQALFIPSAMVRGAIKVLFKMWTPAYPYEITRSRAEAEAFLAGYLAKMG